MTTSDASLETKPTRPNRRRRVVGAACATALALAATLLPTGAASASDWGGYANPASGCGSNYVVKQQDVYANPGYNGTRRYLGKLQIKWSNGCPGNYARFEASGTTPTYIGISIHAQASPYNKAGADETNTRVAYTRVISLARSSDRVCAYLDVNVQAGELLHGSSVLCA